tara:strand:- start:20757 stop:21164 length:408 start_codon:yes stop_codon:yes gene_type:complete
MYVEIKPRQSGKTTRLVDKIVSFLRDNEDKTALVVAKTGDTRKLIQYKVHEKCGDFCSKRTITSHKMFQSPNTMKQFVDEFDLLPTNRLVVDKNAYYTTTTCNTIKCREIWSFYNNGFYKDANVEPNRFIKRHKM